RGGTAQREIDRDRADIAHRRRRWVQIAYHPLIFGLEKIFPACRYRLAAECILVDEQPERAGMNGCPIAIGILNAFRHLLPVHRLVRLERILRLCLHANVTPKYPMSPTGLFFSARICASAFIAGFAKLDINRFAITTSRQGSPASRHERRSARSLHTS